MGRDILTCLHDAERFVREGDRRRTRKRLEEALRELRRPMQRLPNWVVPGADVQWIEKPPHHVYRVISVDRDKPERWTMPETAGPKDKIAAVLAAATEPLSLDEICLRAFGQITERNRSATRTNLHRLDEVGLLVRHPRTYALKKQPSGDSQ